MGGRWLFLWEMAAATLSGLTARQYGGPRAAMLCGKVLLPMQAAITMRMDEEENYTNAVKLGCAGLGQVSGAPHRWRQRAPAGHQGRWQEAGQGARLVSGLVRVAHVCAPSVLAWYTRGGLFASDGMYLP